MKKSCTTYCSSQNNVLSKINKGNSIIESEVNMICNSLPQIIDPNNLKAFGVKNSLNEIANLNDVEFEEFVNFPLFGGDESVTDVIISSIIRVRIE